jgi:GT2 family glycosyltransferase
MRVVVCIVGYRNPDDVIACLCALAQSEFQGFDVQICENGGLDAYVVLERSVAGILGPAHHLGLIQAPDNRGYAAGVNTCISAAPDADAWWILNPDTEPHPAALGRMVEALQEGWDAVGATVHDPSGRVQSRGGRWNSWLARATAIDNGRRLDDPASNRAPFEAGYLSGASLLVGRKFVERAGLMRDDYFLYGEEIEWCLRARSSGLRLGVAPGALVMHRQGTTTGAVSGVAQRGRLAVYLDERNKLLVTRDTRPKQLAVTAVGALIMLMLRFARRGAWRQSAYALEGWMAGLRDERGKPAWIAD